MKNQISQLSRQDIRRFHPHCHELGGIENVKKLTQAISSGAINITCWTNGIQNIVSFPSCGKLIVIIWGTDNPTMFPANNPEKVNYLTKGLSKVLSPVEIENARQQIGILGENLQTNAT